VCSRHPQKFTDLPVGLEPAHSEAIINKDDPNQEGAREAARDALPVADDLDDRNWRTRTQLPPAEGGAAPERELVRGPAPAANGSPAGAAAPGGQQQQRPPSAAPGKQQVGAAEHLFVQCLRRCCGGKAA